MLSRTFLMFLVTFLMPHMAKAEISWVTVSWTPGLCTSVCQQTLARRFGSLAGVADVSINPKLGTAKLYWKPNQPFDYSMLRGPASWVGIGIQDIHVKVRGTIKHNGNTFYLESVGDRTRFALLGPQSQDPTRMTMNNANPASYPINRELRDRLLQAENNSELLSIEGPLFMYWRPPTTLIIQKILYPKEQEGGS